MVRTRSIKLIHALPSHVDDVVADIREEDRQEWLAFTGFPLRPALQWSIRHGIALAAIHDDGTCVCLFGAHPHDDPAGSGLLWLAGANRGYQHVAEFTYLSRKGLEHLHREWPTLVAYVDARNVTHHIWLDAIGFQTTEVTDCGPCLMPFYRVERTLVP